MINSVTTINDIADGVADDMGDGIVDRTPDLSPNRMEPPIVEVCYGPECSDCDGRELAAALQDKGIDVVVGDCRDQCPNAPLAYVNNSMVVEASVERVAHKIAASIA